VIELKDDVYIVIAIVALDSDTQEKFPHLNNVLVDVKGGQLLRNIGSDLLFKVFSYGLQHL
jgi:hypothetical protein